MTDIFTLSKIKILSWVMLEIISALVLGAVSRLVFFPCFPSINPEEAIPVV